MSGRKTGSLVEKSNKDEKTPSHLEVVLKCNYPTKDKDGKPVEDKDGKLKKHKPDDKIKLPYDEAMDLIGRAFAVKA